MSTACRFPSCSFSTTTRHNQAHGNHTVLSTKQCKYLRILRCKIILRSGFTFVYISAPYVVIFSDQSLPISGIGISVSVVMLFCEQFYFQFVRRHLAKVKHSQWFNLISLSIGESLKIPNDAVKSLDHHPAAVADDVDDEGDEKKCLKGKIILFGPAYFLLQLSNCMMETCMLLAGVRVHEHW